MSDNGTRSLGLHCDVRLRHILRVERGRKGMLDIGWPDLQCVLLTSILWPVNRRALWESIIRHPPLTHPLAAHTTSFYWSPWMCGCCPRFTMIHPCGDSPAARLLHHYGHPNLLLDPTHLFPLHKNTTSLPDMLLSHSFLWRCLKATVPTMTLSLGTEALQCRGPVGYFSMNGAGCGGT